MLQKMKQYGWVWGPLALLLASVVIAALMLNGVVPAPTVSVQAVPTLVSADGKQVEPDTAFTLQGSAAMEESDVRALVKLEPELGYLLSRGAVEASDWVLTPGKYLEPGSTVRLYLGTQSLSFPVAKTLLVRSVFPSDGSREVGVRSGIEIQMNLPNIPSSSLKQAISLSPAAEYDLSYSPETDRYVLYAKDSLAYGTEYTLTVSGSLSVDGSTMRGDFVSRFKTVTRMGELSESMFNISGGGVYNSLTSESPILQVYFSHELTQNGSNPKVDVKIFRYDDPAMYKADLAENLTRSMQKRAGTTLASEGLTEFASFVSEPMPMSGEDAYSQGASMVVFPEPLPEGWYLAELSYDTGEPDDDGTPYVLRRYELIQSSDISVFFAHTNDNLLLWVNDAATGLPAEGAQFTMEGTLSTAAPLVTGADGTALVRQNTLRAQNWGDDGVFTITHNGHTFMDARLFSNNYYGEDPILDYTATLFTDRPLYQTTDTVRVWGMVRPRKTGTPMPQKLTLGLRDGDPISITPDAKGLFTAELELAGLSSGYWQVLLTADDKELWTTTVRIYDYIKPVYTSVVKPDKLVYLLSEVNADWRNKPVINVDVSMFDGTPMPQFAGRLRKLWGNDGPAFDENDGAFVTDENGHAEVRTSINCSEQNWRPVQYPIELRSDGAEEESYTASAYLNVIPRDVMLLTEMKAEGSNAVVTVRTHMVDVSRITDEQQLFGNAQENLKGKPVSMELTGELIGSTSVKTQTGTAYDYINRFSVPTYKYDVVQKVERTLTLTTGADGSLVIPDLPTHTESTTYRLKLTGRDTTGRSMLHVVYLYPENDRYWQSQAYNYSLGRVVDPDKLAEAGSGSEGAPSLWELKANFGDGETTSFRLCNNDVPVTEMKGRLLYMTVQKDIDNLTVTDKDALDIPFAEQLLPNYVLTGAYFDGKHIFALDTTSLRFDPALRELEIALDPDKEIYSPGETATITAAVTQKATSKPAVNADLVLAVVDEAIFALEEQNVRILRDLYQSVYYPTINFYASFNGPEYSGPGEKGGGGDDPGIREKFPDTALFATAVTDGNGHATFTFTLPDNITSWRMTALALTGNNHAGNSKDNFIVTKDFYVTPVRSQELLAGDDFVVGLRGAGRAVSTEDPVRYNVTVQGSGVTRSATVDTEGIRRYGWATFSGLPAGDYTVTVRGSCKGFADAVKLPFSVLESGIEVSRAKTVDPAQGLQLQSLRWPVTVTLYGKQYAQYHEVVRAVDSASYGQRSDMRFARVWLDNMRNRSEQSGTAHNSGTTLDDISYGELRYFVNDADPDMRLMAMAALAVPEQYNPGYGEWENQASPAAYYQIQAPGAYQIMRAVRGTMGKTEQVSTTGYTLLDQLDLAAAYAVAGRTDEAKKLYDELVKPYLAVAEGISGEQALSLPGREDFSRHQLTAAASRLATVLKLEDANGLIRYLINRNSRYDPYIMEKLLYLRYTELAGAQSPVKLAYTLNGERMEKTMGSDFVTLTLSKNQLAQLDLLVTGEALADVKYTGKPDDASRDDQKLKITKTITPVAGDTFKTGELVKVTLTADLTGFARDIGDAEVIVDDYLPSAMKFEEFKPAYRPNSVYWWLISRDNQRLRFTANVSGGSMAPIVYYARCAMPGTYVMEGAFLSSGAGDVWGGSERATVTIVP